MGQVYFRRIPGEYGEKFENGKVKVYLTIEGPAKQFPVEVEFQSGQFEATLSPVTVQHANGPIPVDSEFVSYAARPVNVTVVLKDNSGTVEDVWNIYGA